MGANRIELTADVVRGEDGKGLEIFVEGFRHDPTATDDAGTQVFIEVYNGKLQVRVWDGSSEDPQTIVIEPLERPSEPESEMEYERRLRG